MLYVDARHSKYVIIAASFTTLLFFQNCGNFKANNTSLDQLSVSSVSDTPPLNPPAGITPIQPDGIITSVSGALSFSNKSSESINVVFDKIYSESDLTFQCKLGSVMSACNVTSFGTDSIKQRSQAVISIPNTTEGLRELELTATHTSGASGGYRISWIYDKTAPEIDLQPLFNAAAPVAAASFSFSVSDSSKISQIECLLDKNTYSPCTSPVALPALPGGTHYFQIKAIDIAGNASSDEISWMAEVTPSNTQINITGKPGGITESPDANFTFTNTPNIVRLTCQVDFGLVSNCTSTYSVKNLTHGVHKLNINGYDIASKKIASVTYEWTVEIYNNAAMVDNAVIGTFGVDANNAKINYRFSAPSNITGSGFVWTVNGGTFNTVVPYLQLLPKDVIGTKDYAELCVEAEGRKACSKLVLNRIEFQSSNNPTGFSPDKSKLQAIGRNFASDGSYLYTISTRMALSPTDKITLLSDQYIKINSTVYFVRGSAPAVSVPNLSATATLKILTLPSMVPELSSCGLISDGNSLYYADRLIDKVSAAEAQLIPLGASTSSCKFPILKDSKSVLHCDICNPIYVVNASNNNFLPILNADPATFQSIAGSDVYYKDANRVYHIYRGIVTELPGAQPSSFKVFSSATTGYTYDSQKVYYMGKEVIGALGSDVTLKTDNILLSNGYAFNGGLKVEGMNAANFNIVFQSKYGSLVAATFATSNGQLFNLPVYFQPGLPSGYALSGVQLSSLKLVINYTAEGAIFTDSVNVWFAVSKMLASTPGGTPFTLLGPGNETSVRNLNSIFFVFKNAFYHLTMNSTLQSKPVDDGSSLRTLSSSNLFLATNTSVYSRQVGKLTDADPATFQILGANSSSQIYGKDSKNVFYYYQNSPIIGVDALSFEVLTRDYTRDKTQGYYMAIPISGSEGLTFVSLNDHYAKDSKQAYFLSNVLVGADPATFKVTTSYSAQDKNYCYIYQSKNGAPVNGVCP